MQNSGTVSAKDNFFCNKKCARCAWKKQQQHEQQWEWNVQHTVKWSNNNNNNEKRSTNSFVSSPDVMVFCFCIFTRLLSSSISHRFALSLSICVFIFRYVFLFDNFFSLFHLLLYFNIFVCWLFRTSFSDRCCCCRCRSHNFTITYYYMVSSCSLIFSFIQSNCLNFSRLYFILSYFIIIYIVNAFEFHCMNVQMVECRIIRSFNHQNEVKSI